MCVRHCRGQNIKPNPHLPFSHPNIGDRTHKNKKFHKYKVVHIKYQANNKENKY